MYIHFQNDLKNTKTWRKTNFSSFFKNKILHNWLGGVNRSTDNNSYYTIDFLQAYDPFTPVHVTMFEATYHNADRYISNKFKNRLLF